MTTKFTGQFWGKHFILLNRGGRHMNATAYFSFEDGALTVQDRAVSDEDKDIQLTPDEVDYITSSIEEYINYKLNNEKGKELQATKK
jgi:hypothetical protein